MGEYKGDETNGFQSPAQDYIEGVVDLAAILDLRRPGRTPCASKAMPSLAAAFGTAISLSPMPQLNPRPARSASL